MVIPDLSRSTPAGSPGHRRSGRLVVLRRPHEIVGAVERNSREVLIADDRCRHWSDTGCSRLDRRVEGDWIRGADEHPVRNDQAEPVPGGLGCYLVEHAALCVFDHEVTDVDVRPWVPNTMPSRCGLRHRGSR